MDPDEAVALGPVIQVGGARIRLSWAVENMHLKGLFREERRVLLLVVVWMR